MTGRKLAKRFGGRLLPCAGRQTGVKTISAN